MDSERYESSAESSPLANSAIAAGVFSREIGSKFYSDRIPLKSMLRILFHPERAFPRCLLVFLASTILPAVSQPQDLRYQEGWLYAWRNQPSGEFAPDHRKTDPFQSMFSDADIEAHAAKQAPSFLTQFTSNVKTSAPQDAETGSDRIPPEFDSDPDVDETSAWSTNSVRSLTPDVEPGSAGFAELDELLPQTTTLPTITPQQLFSPSPAQYNDCFGWQVLPKGLMYKSYLAGEKEPRMQFVQLHDTRSNRRVWDAVLGGRVGLLRHGNYDSVNPQGFQIDLEGAVFARVLPDEPSAMLEGADFRAGLLATQRFEQTAYKFGYYHISSHIGDEFLIANPAFNRINYVRDSVIAGVTQGLNYSMQVYGEVAYAVGAEGGAKPLEFQFGTQYIPVAKSSFRGAPYLAANYHIREDFGFHGGFNTVGGWGWQGVETQHRLRVGLQYYNGPSMQYQFLDQWENMFGGGIWFDY